MLFNCVGRVFIHRARRADGDCLWWTDEFAQLAGNTLDAARLVTHKIWRTAVTGGDIPFLFRILHRRLPAEKVPQSDLEAVPRGREAKPISQTQCWALNDHARNHIHAAVTMMFAIASGTKLFQPRFMSWSYRNLGHIHRTSMKRTSRMLTFPTNTPK